MRTLRQCLLDCDLALLRAIAEQWGLDLASQPHQAVVAHLSQHIASPEAQADLAGRLTPGEGEALAALLAAGGQMPAGTFARRFGEVRLMGPGRLERERPWSAPLNAAEGLWYNGLIYRVFEPGPGSSQAVIYVPPELRAGLQAWFASRAGPTGQIPRADPRPGDETRHSIADNGIADNGIADNGIADNGIADNDIADNGIADNGIADNACSLLIYAYQCALPPSAIDARWLSRHSLLVRQLTPPGVGPQPLDATAWLIHSIQFLFHVLERAALLKVEDRRLRPDPEHALEWLSAAPFDQLQGLFQAWRDDPTWNELWQTPGLQCEDTGSWRNDPLVARQTALDYLARLEAGQWYSLDGFINAIKSERPDFQRPGGDYTTWYIRDAHSGDYLRGFESWDSVEGRLLRYMLGSALTWLGIVRLAGWPAQDVPSGHVGPAALALTGLGAAMLGKHPPPPQMGDTRFDMGQDGRLYVGNARRYERFQLARVADWLYTQPARQLEAEQSDDGCHYEESRIAGDVTEPHRCEGCVWVYRVTPDSLARARRGRIEAQRLVTFLQDSAGLAVPEHLGRAWQRWEQHGTEVWAAQAVVVRVARPELLEQLLNDPATRDLFQESLSSTVATVAQADWPALQQAMLEMGVLADQKVTPGA